jgi:hypothetical protein
MTSYYLFRQKKLEISAPLSQLISSKLNFMNLYRDDVSSFYSAFPITSLYEKCCTELISKVQDSLGAALGSTHLTNPGDRYKTSEAEWRCRVLCVVLAKETGYRFPYFVLQLLGVFDNLDNNYADPKSIKYKLLESSLLRARLLQTAVFLMCSLLLPAEFTNDIEVNEASVIFGLATKHCLPTSNIILLDKSGSIVREAICQRISSYTQDEGIGSPIYIENLVKNQQLSRDLIKWLNESFAVRFLTGTELNEHVENGVLKASNDGEVQCAYITINGDVKVMMVNELTDIFDFKFKFLVRGNIMDQKAIDKLQRKGITLYLPENLVDDDEDDEDAVNFSQNRAQQGV